MRFLVTMNMPTRQGSTVHQVIAEHPSTSLSEFKRAIEEQDFIVVEEFYRNNESGDHYSIGNVLLNHRFIGKVRVFTKSTHENRHG